MVIASADLLDKNDGDDCNIQDFGIVGYWRISGVLLDLLHVVDQTFVLTKEHNVENLSRRFCWFRRKESIKWSSPPEERTRRQGSVRKSVSTRIERFPP